MKVIVCPADESGCGHYRLIWPAHVAEAAGADVHLQPMAIKVLERGPTVDGRRPVTKIVPPECDVFVCQRPLNLDLVEALELMQQAGVAVVVDVDDAFHAISPRNIAFGGAHPKARPHENWHHLARACKNADLVTVTTRALAEKYGAHGRCVVVPNYVPRSVLSIESKPNDLIGWSGTVATHPDDLQVVGHAVMDVMDRQEYTTFPVVGDGELVGKNLGIPQDWVKPTGWVPFDQYHRMLADTVGIGIVPLEDSAFNRAKSGLKVLEMAALGIPVVASPTPENVRLADAGLCVLASKPREWKRELIELVEDPVERHSRGHAAREAVRSKELTYEQQGWRWAEAWTMTGKAVQG